MAIDYVNDYPCIVKDTLPLDELIPLVKRRDHCRYVLESRLQDGESEEQALSSTIEFQVRTPDGVETRTEKLSDALESTGALDELEAHCKGCPVSQGYDFGCYGVINYPISGKAEQWLAGVAEKIVQGGSVESSILHFILDANVDGGVITRMRAAGEEYIELRKPMEVVVEKGRFKKTVVNTDQILNVLLSEQLLAYPLGALRFSGGISEAGSKPDCPSGAMTAMVAGDDGKVSWLIYDLPDSDADDHSVRDVKKFFRALFIAYAHDSIMVIDT